MQGPDSCLLELSFECYGMVQTSEKDISRATDTEKRCILGYKLMPYLILLAYKGLSYEKVTTSLRSHLHDSYISGMK